MKTNKILASLAIATFLLSGCTATKSSEIAMNIQKNAKKMSMDLNLNMKSTPPNIEQLKTYAQNSRSKYFANLIALSYQDYALIPTKLVDPVTNEEAKVMDEKDWNDVKLQLQRVGEKMNFSKDVMDQALRYTKKNFNKPFYVMTDLPEGASRGVIKNGYTATLDQLHAEHSKDIVIYFSFKDELDRKKVFDSLVADLDQFFSQDTGWEKTNYQIAESQKNIVEDWKSIISQQKQLLSEKGNSPKDQLEKEDIIEKIKIYEGYLADNQKQLISAQKTNFIKEQITYTYKHLLNSSTKNIHMVTVSMKADTVQVVINRVVKK